MLLVIILRIQVAYPSNTHATQIEYPNFFGMYATRIGMEYIQVQQYPCFIGDWQMDYNIHSILVMVWCIRIQKYNLLVNADATFHQ